MGWLERLNTGLAKTRTAMRGTFDRMIGRTPDPVLLEEIEAALLSADLGVRIVERLMEALKTRGRGGEAGTGEPLRRLVQEEILAILRLTQGPTLGRLIEQGPRPFVLLVVGVNGVGKTTTIAKLAQRFLQEGKTPLLVAGDTFRAAAIDQLQVWADRLKVELVRHRPGADPAAVAFDGLSAAKARHVDVLLIDSAGRLHTKTNLMDELRKVKRVLSQSAAGAPHEVLLVLDATVGQNALAQARQFQEAVGVTGLAVTKLDGTARAGIVVAISEELKLPVRLVGLGESVDDLQDFQADAFVKALL